MNINFNSYPEMVESAFVWGNGIESIDDIAEMLAWLSGHKEDIPMDDLVIALANLKVNAENPMNHDVWRVLYYTLSAITENCKMKRIAQRFM